VTRVRLENDTLKGISDPEQYLTTIEWQDLPLLMCDDPKGKFGRLLTTPPDPATGGMMWSTEAARAATVAAAGYPTALAMRFSSFTLCATALSSSSL
jgi:hypothetical protein